ncbi:MAG TPA: glycosyltransferase family 2 protein [Gemmatimonadota bacterium]|nr:glycosyltransferase family 2 protein [Gemmatimonadota bacterium]
MIRIVLPAYNEAAGLVQLLDRIAQRVTREHEVILVDDGSTDGTAAVAEQAAGRRPIRVLRHPVNQGYGRALRTGLLAAADRGGTVVTLDADDTHDPALIEELVAGIEGGYDLVVASRYRPGAAEVGVPAYRRALSRVASVVFRTAIGIEGLHDYTSGFRAYRGSLLAELVGIHGREGLVEDAGFASGFELLLKSAALGARVGEVPLVLRYDRKRGPSKLSVARTLPRYLKVVTANGLGARRGDRLAAACPESRP